MIAPDPWIEHLAEHLPVARAGADPEGVHQVRAACARLRVFLRLAGRRADLALSNGHAPAALHDCRRALRQLRHACEWADVEPRPPARVLAALGRLHDAEVGLDWLRRSPFAQAHAGHAARLQDEQRAADEEFRALWRARGRGPESLA